MPDKLNLAKSISKYQHYSAHHYKGQILYWVLLFIILSSICSLPFIYIDVSVQSRGVINTMHKLSAITSPITAKVLKVHIAENNRVGHGDTLIVLDQSGLNNELFISKQQVLLQQAYLQDLEELTGASGQNLSSTLYQQEYLDYIEAISKYKRKINKLQNEFKRTKDLYLDGVMPLSVFEEDSFKLNEVVDELSLFKTATQARWETEKRDYTLAIHELNGRLEHLKYQISQCYIIAPFDGNIIEFNGIAEGSFLPKDELVGYISPLGDLIVECHVSPTDIGLINKEMDVRFQIDAYNYNQWGLLNGQVIDVANDVSLKNGQYVYVVRCRVCKEYLELSNGVKGSLKKGMSLTGRFVVNRRSLFQLLFDNMDDWFNPKVLSE